MIRKTLKVPLPPAEAFDLFARRMGEWWPERRRRRRRRALTVEPRRGGAVFETGADGRREAWGRVAHWAPGERLDLDWWEGRTEADATRVTVRFLPEPGGTRVDLTHADGARVPLSSMREMLVAA